MMLDVAVIIFLFIEFFLGRKKGFTYSFFTLFKYLLIIFLIENFYNVLRTVYKINNKTEDEQLKIYIIIFLILYVVISIVLMMNKKMLQTIKLKKCDSFLGGIFGLIKVTFIIFIVYIVIIFGSANSKRIKKVRDDSFTVKIITEYLYFYENAFPDFIKKNLEIYRKNKVEEKIEEKILNDFKANRLDTENK